MEGKSQRFIKKWPPGDVADLPKMLYTLPNPNQLVTQLNIQKETIPKLNVKHFFSSFYLFSFSYIVLDLCLTLEYFMLDILIE